MNAVQLIVLGIMYAVPFAILAFGAWANARDDKLTDQRMKDEESR